MIPRRKKHIAKPVRPLFNPADFYKDFHNETVVKARLAELEKLKMDEMQSKRGWIGYELPDCSWTNSWHPSLSVSNYRCWPSEARGWILQVVDESGNNTCMLRRKAVYEMPDKEWEKLMNVVRKLKDDYPMLDDGDHSNVETEYQDEEWAETYREQFQKAMAEKFEGVFLTMQFGDRIQQKFEEMINDKTLTDRFFFEYARNDFQGEEWTEAQDGDWSLDVDEVVGRIDTSDVAHYLWPEDPKQLKFKFMRQAEALVKQMLSDDLMVMIDSPPAHRIVDTLLEDEGSHSYSCVMINLPEEMANEVTAWGRLQVKDEDVIVDEKGGKGREMEPHITVLYGLLDEKPSDILEQVFENTAPFDIKLGPCSLFKEKDHDVLKMEVISPFLHALNRNIRAVAAYENDYPDFKPHVTITYVQPGTADRLEGASPWDDPVKLGVTKLGQEGVFTAKEVIFSSKNGQKTTHTLGKGKVAAKAVKENVNWQQVLFEAQFGRQPQQEGELNKWLREASQLYYQSTGKIKGLREWMEGYLTEVEDDAEMAAFVAGSGALDTPSKISHKTIRRILGKHIVDKVEIWDKSEDARQYRVANPLAAGIPYGGKIKIVYRENGRFDPSRKVWSENWSSFEVLKWALRNWRNLYGVKLFVNDQEAGVVGYRNPALVE